MRPSFPLLPLLFITLASACSQNPHVDEATPTAVTAAAAVQTPVTPDDPQDIVADRDHDGVLDPADECPDVAGPAENNGCPYNNDEDYDGDGVIDTDDECPVVPGPITNDGCPDFGSDRDGDFVPDANDFCPNLPGQVYYDGCPFDIDREDRDRDGVLDRFDECPYLPGPRFNKGCPVQGRDRDHDGTPDYRDDCPLVPGPHSHRGCPYPRKEERKVLLEVKESLKFDFDKATIKESSFPALERLVAFMKKYPGSQLKMVGHTDEVGTTQYNQDLSEARVYSVKRYLTAHGISAGRIEVHAKGETQPLVRTDGLRGNALAAAQAKNRRVDMSIRYVTAE
ncbi:MAG TPA: OmpA family protein [Bdellovibrionota bacterium]|jgi:outer membrane protein OmpA-like peptidoglycan-associated protein